MAIVPTYTSEAGLPAGGSAPQADVGAFTAPARALTQVGNQISETGASIGGMLFKLSEQKFKIDERQAQIEERNAQIAKAEKEQLDKQIEIEERRRRDQEFAFWKQKTGNYAERKITEFRESKENQSDPKFYENLDALADQLKIEISGQVDDQEYLKYVDGMVDDIVNRSRAGILEKRESVLNEKFTLGVREFVSGTVESLYANNGDPALAQKRLVELSEFINSGSLTDLKKSELRGNAVASIALGSAPVNPGWAKSLIEMSKDIQPDAKVRLLDEIERTQKVKNFSAVDQFDKQVRLAINLAKKDGTRIPEINFDNAKAFFVGDEAKFSKYKETIQAEINTYNQAFDIIADIASKNSSTRTAVAAERLKGVDPMIFGDVQKIVADSLEAMDRDFKLNPYSYITKHNRVAKGMATYVSMMPAGPDRDSMQQQLDDLVWTLQGYPSEIKERNAYFSSMLEDDDFHRKPDGERSLLDEAEATKLADSIASGSPEQRLAAFDALELRFPADNFRAVALSDIEQKVPSGRMSIQQLMAASQLNKHGYKQIALDVLKANETFSKIGDSDKKILDGLLDLGDTGHPDWKKIASVTRGANGDAQHLVDGFRLAVKGVAAKLVLEQKSAYKALDSAIQLVFKDHFLIGDSFPITGGKRSSIPVSLYELNDLGQVDKSLGKRDAADVEQIMSVLEVQKEQIDPRDVAVFDENGTPLFPNISGLYIGGRKANYDLLKEKIRFNGEWKSDPSMQSATFYVDAKEGGQVALINKLTGLPYTVSFKGIRYTGTNRQPQKPFQNIYGSMKY